MSRITRLACLAVLVALTATWPAAAWSAPPTLAGTGVTDPAGLTTMGPNLWISDHVSGFCRLDRGSDGMLALSTACSLAAISPTDPSFDPATNFVYVGDNASQSQGVWRLPYSPSLNTVGTGTLLLPGQLAGLRVEGTALGPDGKLYVGFEKTAVISRIVNPSGPSSSWRLESVGQTTDGEGVSGLAFVGSDLYLAQAGGVTKIAMATVCAPFCSTQPVSMPVTGPSAIASDGQDLYVADTPFGATRLVRHRVAAGTSEFLATGGTLPDGSTEPFAFADALYVEGPTGTLYIGDDPTDGAAGGQGRLWATDVVALPPTFSGSTPLSPANDNAPEIKGTAEAGSTVRLYSDPACTALVATGSAAQFASPGITVGVADNSSTTFYGAATDAAGNVSACSASSLTFVEDSIAPVPPDVTGSSPPSPANDNSPEIKGSADADTTVRLHRNPTCSFSPAVTGTAAQFANPGLTVSVADGSGTRFSATAVDQAGNVSSCSTVTYLYVEDSSAPAAPPAPNLTAASDTGASASDDVTRDSTPTFTGSAEAGSTVLILVDGVEQGSGPATPYSITTSALLDGSHSVTAVARDAAGNVSAPSAALSITIDTAAPAAPAVTGSAPLSPANDNSPEIKGSAEAGATVRLHRNATCAFSPVATGTAVQFADPGLTVSVADGSGTRFSATALDAAGNSSPCSSTTYLYVEDSVAPAAPPAPDLTAASDTGASASDNLTKDSTPTFSGSAAGASTVLILVDGVEQGSGPASPYSITTSALADGTHAVTAVARDAAGNVSPPSPALSVTIDTAAPAAPAVTGSSPLSPANDNAPEIKGSAEAGSTVRLHRNSTCAFSPVATGTAVQFADPGLTVSVADGSGTRFSATALDAAGNSSACSSTTYLYVEDSAAPAAPPAPDLTAASDTGASASDNVTKDSTPTFAGSAAGASTVLILVDGFEQGSGPATPYSITTSALADGTYAVTAVARDAAGNVSPPSPALSVTIDTAAPAAPIITGSNPPSPANDNSPEIKGSAEAGATVRLHRNTTCAFSAIATGSAAQFADPGITVGVADNSHTNFTATAVDAAGNGSACSAVPYHYFENSSLPPPGP